MRGNLARQPVPFLTDRVYPLRVRGNRTIWSRLWMTTGSIPACAGEPLSHYWVHSLRQVNPRVCGGTLIGLTFGRGGAGLSPRVRGNLQGPVGGPGFLRSIPACAGEPRTPAGPAWSPRVYPRVCGGTGHRYTARPCAWGLSPRVRGNRRQYHFRLLLERSIPACAGEPKCASPVSWAPRVYPRVCGGTGWGRELLNDREGLSPRVRGEPRIHPLQQPARRVYPRVCGGTMATAPIISIVWGLSPRVRGNRRRTEQAHQHQGSIPACAGEPSPGQTLARFDTVYPRVCGGTTSYSGIAGTLVGLSPRVRGNPRPGPGQPPQCGSIPACAGEPPGYAAAWGMWRVYPRVCGGTRATDAQVILDPGLSPRVRGNRAGSGGRGTPSGSIPACAGEPGRWWRTPGPRTVYPRVCGGTPPPECPSCGRIGLSPRVRGNPIGNQRRVASTRSIPACAGEPRVSAMSGRMRAVYPRVCGGTRRKRRSGRGVKGLSPRVRGNRPPPMPAVTISRSIPACAGEPFGRMRFQTLITVYPRVCGGTLRLTGSICPV